MEADRAGQAFHGERSYDRDRWHSLFFLALATFLTSLTVSLAIVAGAACGSANPEPATTDPIARTATPQAETPEATSAATATPGAKVETPAPTETTPTSDRTPAGTAASTSDAAKVVACGDILVPLSKKSRLPADCAPGGLVALDAAQGSQVLRREAAAAFASLVAAAKADGFDLVAVSAYRSYNNQIATYDANVRQFGQEYADRTSARPGHSEHQLGTTVDVSSPAAGFGLEAFIGTDEADWVAENSWKFGFIVSYPAGREGVTGYAYEPWHIRWVGTGVASQVKSSGATLVEFLGGP